VSFKTYGVIISFMTRECNGNTTMSLTGVLAYWFTICASPISPVSVPASLQGFRLQHFRVHISADRAPISGRIQIGWPACQWTTERVRRIVRYFDNWRQWLSAGIRTFTVLL